MLYESAAVVVIVTGLGCLWTAYLCRKRDEHTTIAIDLLKDGFERVSKVDGLVMADMRSINKDTNERMKDLFAVISHAPQEQYATLLNRLMTMVEQSAQNTQTTHLTKEMQPIPDMTDNSAATPIWEDVRAVVGAPQIEEAQEVGN